jgi:hypothetical protein
MKEWIKGKVENKIRVKLKRKYILQSEVHWLELELRLYQT